MSQLVEGRSFCPTRITVPRCVLFAYSTGCVLVFWVLSCAFFRALALPPAVVITTTVSFALIGLLAIELVSGLVTRAIKFYLLAWLAYKLVLGVAFFTTVYMEQSGSTASIIHYGDSSLHQQIAVNYLEYWSQGNLLGNPPNLATLIDQWGYGYTLALLYVVTGTIPEVGVAFNGLMAFLALLLAYRLFLTAGMSRRAASFSLLLLSFSPELWLVSSYLYKDSALMVIILASSLFVLQVVRRLGALNLLGAFASTAALVTFRYSYVFAMAFLFLLGSVWDQGTSVPSRLRRLVIYSAILIVAITLLDRLQIYNRLRPEAMVAYIQRATSLPTVGGQFMTEGLGSQITITNFYYALPAKAVYLLTIPFPWFGGRSTAEQVDFVFSHADSIYCLALLVAVLARLFSFKSANANPIEYILIFTGGLLFLAPLFMYSPSRRYLLPCVPFLIAYAGPYLRDARNARDSLAVALVAVLAVQILYYLR